MTGIRSTESETESRLIHEFLNHQLDLGVMLISKLKFILITFNSHIIRHRSTHSHRSGTSIVIETGNYALFRFIPAPKY